MTESNKSKLINEERVSNFKKELRVLLKKYKVEITLESDDRSYYPTSYMEFYFHGYEEDDVYVHGMSIPLGTSSYDWTD